MRGSGRRTRSRLRRPHRRRAARRPAIAGGSIRSRPNRRRQALGTRRGDMKAGLPPRRRRAGLRRQRPFAGSIASSITSDEEGPAVNGTVKLLEWALKAGERFDHCIVGEPTSSARSATRSSTAGAARCRAARHPRPPGPCRLSASRERIRSAARGPHDGAASPPLDDGNADFEPSNLEVISVDVGNPAANVIPGEVRPSSTSASTIFGRPNPLRRRSRGGSPQRAAAPARRSPSSRATLSPF